MFTTFVLFISGVISIAVLDYVWIGTLFASFYKSRIGTLARLVNGEFSPNLVAGTLVYVLMSIGIIAFVLPNGGGIILRTMLFGALWGLILGGVYELTNYSLLAQWNIGLVVLDMFWTTLSGSLTALILLAIKKII